MYSGPYDAGIENNTGEFADLVPPCPVLSGVSSGEPGSGMSNRALSEVGIIHMHTNVHGIVDLDPAIHGWLDLVAKIVVTRIKLPDGNAYRPLRSHQ
jgi:hypothetical protein